MTFPLVNLSRIPREEVSSFSMGFSDLSGRPDKDIHGDLARRKKVRDRDTSVHLLPLVLEVIKLAGLPPVLHLHPIAAWQCSDRTTLQRNGSLACRS